MKKIFASLKYIPIALLVFSWGFVSMAQETGIYHDVARFSPTTNFVGGSGRTLGVGGASTALGADMANLVNNPAGLAMYRRSDFVFGLGLGVNSGNTTYRGESVDNATTRLNVPMLGIAIANMKDKIEGGKFRGYTIGFGINRIKDFNTNLSFSGLAPANIRQTPVLDANGNQIRDAQGFPVFNVAADNISYIDALRRLRDENNITPGDIFSQGTVTLESELMRQAFENFLFDQDTVNNRLPTFMPVSDMRQSGSYKTRGRQLSYDFAAAGNYNDRLYFGGGISLITTDFTETKEITEQFANVRTDVYGQEDPRNVRYNNAFYTLTNTFSYSGTGVNLKAGLQYRLTDGVRLGVSYQSPTWQSITMSRTINLSSQFNGAPYGNDVLGSQSYLINTIPDFTYRLTSPQRLSAGALFLGNWGFFSADVDVINYSSASVRDRNSPILTSDNNTISSAYVSNAVNFRLGAELRLQNWRLRGGYGYQQSPYNTANVNTANNALFVKDIVTLSGGFGYRTPDYYIDFTLMNRSFATNFINHFYTPVANASLSATTIMATMGFPF